MRFLLFILLAPAFAHAKTVEEIADHTFVNFAKAGGAQPVNELILSDSSKVWIHGCNHGSKVTLNGEPLEGGEYTVQNMDIIIKVDEQGNLLEPINNKTDSIICMDH